MASKPTQSKHARIRQTLTDQIAGGRYDAGQRLPSESELVKTFGVSRPTVNRALRELQLAGLIDRRAGSGSYVRADAGAHGYVFGLLIPELGLFMSIIYPTINSKGISCLPKAEHGAGAGVILFFTCVSAVLAPLAIGAVGDAFGQIAYGFWLATGFAALLFAGLLLNWALNPTRAVLEQLDLTEYQRAPRQI